MSSTVIAPSSSETVEKPRQYTLDATHRCDSCGAQAYLKVFMEESGLDLLFCRHDYLKHEAALSLVIDIEKTIDETDRLTHNRHKGSENS